jgi:predicted nucleic acid-binding protein
MILPMPVVSNTSPIWNLISLERLDLLHDQFPECIPQDVLDELQVGHDYPEMARIQQALDAQWLRVASLTNLYVQQSLMLELDRGEAAAIALALELGLTHILIDEADGRATAKAMGLRPIGVLGILLRAKHAGKIVSLSEEMSRLRHDAGFFIAESLFQRLRKEVGETP